MANRHLSRSVVLQTLFEWDFRDDIEASQAHDLLIENIEEFAPGSNDISYMENLLKGVISKVEDLNAIIEKAAPDWPLSKIAIVDRNILRLGLFELLFADRAEVPAKVAINEAIELAKKFGGETSGKFINGVVGAVYKEMGEPGKDQESPKKKKKDQKPEVPYEEMLIEKKVGAIVYAIEDKEIYFGLVHDVFGHWTLSKGGLKGDEDDEAGLKRVIKEEMDLNIINMREKLGDTEYIANHPEKGKHRKQVAFYLAEAEFTDVTLGKPGGLDDAKWFKASDILDLNFYDDIVTLMTKAVNILSKEVSS